MSVSILFFNIKDIYVYLFTYKELDIKELLRQELVVNTLLITALKARQRQMISVCSKSAWSAESVPDQSGLHNETMFKIIRLRLIFYSTASQRLNTSSLKNNCSIETLFIEKISQTSRKLFEAAFKFL